jgi:hypothetical protein
MAVTAAAEALSYNGTSWSAPTTIESGFADLTGVSCATSSSCFAIDDNGNAIGYSGGTWESPTTLNYGSQLYSVSCATATFCAAVDDIGYAYLYQPIVGFQITTVAVAPALKKHSYHFTLQATGAPTPYTWKSLGGLPKGIKLNKKTGVLSGKAKATGTYSFTAEVTAHGGSPTTSKTFTMFVNP